MGLYLILFPLPHLSSEIAQYETFFFLFFASRNLAQFSSLSELPMLYFWMLSTTLHDYLWKIIHVSVPHPVSSLITLCFSNHHAHLEYFQVLQNQIGKNFNNYEGRNTSLSKGYLTCKCSKEFRYSLKQTHLGSCGSQSPRWHLYFIIGMCD